MEFFNDLGTDPLKPSLFELVAHEQLRDLLQPALKYVLAVFAQRYPRYLLRVVNRHEEFYAAIMLLVERYYLRKYNASFSENFYGLKRRRRPYIETTRAKAAVGGVPPGEALGSRELLRSLLFLVGVPYLRAKAQDYWEELGGGVDTDVLDETVGTRQLQALTENTWKARLKRVFKAAYPWLNVSYEGWLLLYNMAYLFDRTPFYRPWLSWIGVDLRRLGSEDFRVAALAAQKKLSPDRSRGTLALIKHALISSPQTLLDSLRLLLPTAIFFIKFLEWWYSPASPARSLSTSPLGPAIPPPQMLPPHPHGITFNKDGYGICPLLRQNIADNLLAEGDLCQNCTRPQRFFSDEGALTRIFLGIQITTYRPFLQFGKHIQAQQIPGWSSYYLDYKLFKKIISSLAAKRPASEAAALASGIRPTDILAQSPSPTPPSRSPSSILDYGLRRPPIVSATGQDSDRGPDFRAHKAAFFFRLERLKFEGSAASDIFTQQILAERSPPTGPFRDLENNLRSAVTAHETTTIAECVRYSEVLAEYVGGKPIVTRILWNIIVEAPPDIADLILSSLSSPFDFHFVDDINGRTCLHGASIAGVLFLVDLCIQNGVRVEKTDLYGRTALHYASMNGHPAVCKRLLETGLPSSIVDRDNYSPLVYATMKGKVECVRVLLDEGKVPAGPTTPLGDLIPLSLASQSGHVDVVVLLLQYGARCLPNSNGEFPMHLAAREGHAEVCKILINLEGWDAPDKYHEWTPLFHAARYGQDRCVRILLEAGARVCATDEIGHLSVHYAAWYGHHRSLSLILDAARNKPISTPAPVMFESPMSEKGGQSETDIDHIPSLSLPPPIMPHRVYGHKYLDKSSLVQVTIGHTAHRSDNISGVRLHHRLISPVFEDEYLLASTPLKLVMTSSHNVNNAPYSVSLPQRDEDGVFAFQINSLDNLSLEFSIYPNFGTRTIGRAVALPALFCNLKNNNAFTLPILDTRLHVVGEASKKKLPSLSSTYSLTLAKVDFEIKITTPFEGVTLDFGGDVETYWKSMTVPPSITQSDRPKRSRRSKLIGSAQASPSAHAITNQGNQFLTISSLQGTYIYATVQVTKDLQPVIFSEWLLPGADFELGVSDVTLVQFELLARRLGKEGPSGTLSVGEMASLPRSMLSLTQFLKVFTNTPLMTLPHKLSFLASSR
ncbi:hypothetical protein C0992_003412 [Termitomyces sp. T32_za158]|nr:hypothetical protein C0992_003412 [Termitomyces sp. T32_za158]